jgi:peptidyl-prolyl cis-trans isomerase D
MLQTLRNNTKIILWITVIAFVGLIVLVWGADLQFGQPDPGTIGQVNGQTIPYQYYQRVLNEQIRAFRAQQDRELTFEDERRLSQQTWDLLINDALVSQAAAKQGVPVTDAEIVFWAQTNPPPEAMQSPQFADEQGNFDVQRYHASLQQQPAQWVWYERRLRSQLPADKLRQLVLSSAKVSQTEVDDFMRDLAEQRVISYARIDPATISVDEESITDEVAQEFYQQHLDEFMTGERARIRFVKVDKVASEADEAAAVQDLLDYRTDVQKDMAGGLAEAQTTFAALAGSFSDGAQAEAGGSWGEAKTRDRIRPARLAEVVFDTQVGQLSEPFRVGNRYFLVMVNEETADSARAFSVIERELRPGAEQMQALRSQVRELGGAARRDGLEAAAAAGFQTEETDPFTASGFVPQLLGWREPVEFAFDNQIGAVGGPDESADAWIIYEVSDRLEPEPYPFEQVKSTVRRRVIQERQRTAARAEAEELAAAIRNQGFAKGAKTAGVEAEQSGRFSRRAPIEGLGSDPALVAEVFPLAVGEVSGLIEGDTGFYVARTDSIVATPPEEVESQRQTARMILERERQLQVFQSWLEELRADAEIVDYRYR